MQTSRMLSNRFRPLGLLLLLIVVLYANSLGNSFHFDDFHTVSDNPAIRSLSNLPRIFADATAFSVLPANQTYRPLVTASLAFDYAMGHGANVFWFHLSSLAWFLVLIAVFYLLADLLFERTEPSTANRWLALGTAAWFGLHPAMAETVNYVIQRGDLYCTLGCMAALWIYAARPDRRRHGLYLLPFVLAMLSKPPAAVFPLLLMLYVFFFEVEDQPTGSRWIRSAMAALPAVGIDAAMLWLQAAMTPKSYAPSILSPSAYRLVQPYVWLRYAEALFLPLHLNVDTDLQPLPHFNMQAAVGLVFVMALLLVAFMAARQRRLYPVSFGLLWFVLTQLPTSIYTLSEVENDHRMFFSFPGLMLAVVWAAYLVFQRFTATLSAAKRRAMVRLAAALSLATLGGYAYGAHRRNQVWHDEMSLWADDVAKAPHNGRGLMNYGLARMGVGDFTGARDLFNRALIYTPNYATLEINLGVVNGLLANAGHPELKEAAEQHFERAAFLAPGDDASHSFYGRWLLAQGRTAEAVAQLQSAVALNASRQMQRDLLLEAYARLGNEQAARPLAESTLALFPEDADALRTLHGGAPGAQPPRATALINASLASYRAGEFIQSIAQAEEAVRIDPRSAEAWNNVGAGYGALQQWDRGIAAEQEAVRLNPGLLIATNNLRWFQAEKAMTAPGNRPALAAQTSAASFVNQSLALNREGKYVESLAAANKAVELDPASAEAWNNVAANDEALERWDDAIAAARRAVALRPDFQLAKNNLAWSVQQKQAQERLQGHR